MLAQVSNRENVRNQNGNVVNENVQENVKKVLVNGNQVGCSYKEFLACNPREYDGKGGAVVLTRWIEKIESVHDMSGFSNDQKIKYTAGLFMGKALTWWNSQIGTLSRKVVVSMSWNDFKDGHAAYTDRFHELARLVPHLVTPESRMIERDCRGVPRNVNPVNDRNPTVRAYYECGSTDHVRSACPNNRAQGLGENHPNQAASNNGGQGHGNQGNHTRGWAFMLGAEEARYDPNIVTGTFTLNNHYATTLFDYGADYSFVSTTFIPLLGLEPNDLGFRYEIGIASGQLVEIDKVIEGCKLKIKGHVVDIDLIPFGHKGFDVIIGMDWLSNYKAETVCHEKVVRIPLSDGKVLRVVGERPEEKERFLMGVKKQEEIVVVRDFPEVLLDDLSGLPPIREIELIPRATPVVKSLISFGTF
nr:putative reverse transcriptase domain-containing protein [Tanacetum cinerariifolium]